MSSNYLQWCCFPRCECNWRQRVWLLRVCFPSPCSLPICWLDLEEISRKICSQKNILSLTSSTGCLCVLNRVRTLSQNKFPGLFLASKGFFQDPRCISTIFKLVELPNWLLRYVFQENSDNWVYRFPGFSRNSYHFQGLSSPGKC